MKKPKPKPFFPARVCVRCTRIGRRDGFVCELPGCPRELVRVESAAAYRELAGEPVAKPAVRVEARDNDRSGKIAALFDA